jgi:hypothetical protein
MASPSQNNGIPLGALTPNSTWGEYNNIIFAVQQAISKLQTATLVRIETCTNDGDLSPVGLVDVTPLVNQIDGSGNPTPHVTVYGLPYLRMQGGTSAIIIDPKPGDIGVAVFASRDVSKVKSTKAQANPGSFRSYDFADGLYLGGMLNAAPTQYIRFGNDGITIVAANIKASDGISTPLPVLSQPFLTWVTTVLIPALTAHGITLPTPPPIDSVTTVFKAL